MIVYIRAFPQNSVVFWGVVQMAHTSWCWKLTSSSSDPDTPTLMTSRVLMDPKFACDSIETMFHCSPDEGRKKGLPILFLGVASSYDNACKGWKSCQRVLRLSKFYVGCLHEIAKQDHTRSEQKKRTHFWALVFPLSVNIRQHHLRVYKHHDLHGHRRCELQLNWL